MPSSIEKLQKFFRLEIERGYDNRAVVGGLDKILPSWESDARANQVEETVIQTIITGLQEYPVLEPPQRADMLARLMTELERVKSSQVVEPKPVSTDERQGSPRMENNHRPDPRPRRAQPSSTRQTPAPSQPHRSGTKSYPTDTPGLDAPLQVLQGVGSKLAQTLSTLGLNKLEDLLYFFPRRYDDYSQLKPINRLEFGEETTVLGTIQSIFSRPIRGGKMQMTEAVIGDGTSFMRVNWFNQPWLASKYPQGAQVVLAGKIDQYLGRLTMTNPEIEPVETEHLHTNRIVPVYALTAGLNQKNLRRLMHQTIMYWAPRVTDHLPERVRSAVKLSSLGDALVNIHFPESADMLEVARWRLAFDEIFLLQLGVLSQKRSWQAASAQVFDTPPEWLEHQVARLPFALTGAQQRVLQDIRTDLASGRPMDRLVQGDVGSGKTVVAALVIAMVNRQGGQAAVMAPTSILAEQHCRTFTRLLTLPDEEGEAPLRSEEVRLLIGDTPEAEKENIRAGLADGSIKVVIGTHALIESPVQFQSLQLAVIDEQHRFGVSQRAALRSKGTNPHLLVMTATPIPRSLALTVYGDLDVSVMDEMPAGRQPVGTFILRPLERERAYNLVRTQVQQDHQAFIIYPLVEQGDSIDPATGAPVVAGAPAMAAVEQHRRLQTEIFPKLKLGLLHGRMKPEEKDQTMKDFRDRRFDILVSTTVVEVGVDIPNATVMVIEGANRFGLAQLHQLRGRVGRSSVQSYCLLIPDKEDAVENERLAVMSETNDGFALAERDLQQRGPGEFLGTRQAGFSELKLANLTDIRLIEKARQQAQVLFQTDPDLTAPEHQLLSRQLLQFWGGGKGDIS
jgi:ATP-dependent DNA helicase RecG